MNEILWSGHLFDLSGYATANRNLLFRAANSMTIQITRDGLQHEPIMVDSYTLSRLRAHAEAKVGPRAPFLRFYVPLREHHEMHVGNRYKICYTMMETEGLHPEFRDRVNEYDECWTPTAWGARVMRAHGVDIPVRQAPLGVNPAIFRPGAGNAVKTYPARLLTTDRAGEWERPSGFRFLTVGQPTFRKGYAFLIRAFSKAFAHDPDVSLTIMTTIHATDLEKFMPDVKEELGRCHAHVYHGVIEDAREESRRDAVMASLYSFYDAYVTASLGEGWNLPMCEAAACGLPVIASGVGAHRELLEDGFAWMFQPEGVAPIPGVEKLCSFYEGQPFAVFGERSLEELVTHLREVRQETPDVQFRAERLGIIMRNEWTWDRAAATLVDRVQSLSD